MTDQTQPLSTKETAELAGLLRLAELGQLTPPTFKRVRELGGRHDAALAQAEQH